MAGPLYFDRVKETTTTTGTGTVTLGGPSTSFQAWSVVGNGNTAHYCIVHQSLNEWEVGLGTYTASGSTLARTSVLASSNAGAAVNFSAGLKDVFLTLPAAALPVAATQADQETASSTTAFVSPGRQHFHVAANKFWLALDGTGTIAIKSSYNVTSVTDNGVGDYTINFTTAFSNANYAVAGQAGQASSGVATLTGGDGTPSGGLKAAGAYRFRALNSTAYGDLSDLNVAGWGDL